MNVPFLRDCFHYRTQRSLETSGPLLWPMRPYRTLLLEVLTFYYYMPCMGVMSAATVRVGNALGAGRPERAWEEVKTATIVSILLMVLFLEFLLKDAFTRKDHDLITS